MMKIGFCNEENTAPAASVAECEETRAAAPRRSVVKVSFPDSDGTLDYYNDSFDLKVGDRVFVEGSKAGLPGKVTEDTYNFKIKLSDYRRVISVADTEVHGEFFCAGDHFVTFDPAVIPASKIRSWFLPVAAEEDKYVTGSDGSSFPVHAMTGEEFRQAIAERGHAYYMENRVTYLSLNRGKGYAIVVGSEPYEVEFDFDGENVSNLVCSCPCSYNCKHEFAAMIQLMETLDCIDGQYRELYNIA